MLLRGIRTYFLNRPFVIIWIFFFGKAENAVLCICKFFLLGRERKVSLMYKTFLAFFATCAKDLDLFSSFSIALIDLVIVSLFGHRGIGSGDCLILL